MQATKADLIRHDEKGCWEFPSEFDYDSLDREARALHAELQTQLGRDLGFEDGWSNQDASFSWAVILQSHQQGPTMIVQTSLRISNYGRLVAVTDPDYESTDECERVLKICEEFGYTPVPTELLHGKYDGINGNSFPNWWIRYFDWL